jgi:hypothetical protein
LQVPGLTAVENAILVAKYAHGLRPYLQQPLSAHEALEMYDRQYRQREESFLHLLREAVFGNPRSPYLELLAWAGAGFGDIAAMVQKDGIEDALAALHAAGVWVSLDEFKGRSSIRRNGLEIPVRAADFDNPLLNVRLRSQTSGSRGPARVLSFALEHLTDDVPTHALFLTVFGIDAYPMVLWRPVPPGAAGLRRALIHAKLGLVPEKWFSQSACAWPAAPARSVVFSAVTVWACRRWGGGFPTPQHVPLDRAQVVADWIAARKLAGVSLHVTTPTSSAARVCLAAQQSGLDIAGTFFCVSGEAYTSHTHGLVQSVGARAGCFYSVTEIGQIGCGCGDAIAVDDVHLMRNKVAVIQPHPVGTGGAAQLFLTSLRASAPKVLLNVESGDTAVLERRRCRCAASRPGLDWHVHTVRSPEKLTSEGTHFLGADLLRLVEHVLPAAHGGHATDYQVWDMFSDGLPRVGIVVSPRLGPIDERTVVETVLGFLGSRSAADRMMAAHWRQGNTLRVLRREPVVTSSAKTHALHVVAEPERT